MQNRIFKPSDNKPINPHLDNLEQVQQKVEEIIKEKENTVKEIRDGFVECVVIFIDLVDSTKFKIENSSKPEKWILRVKQFGDIIKEYIENSNGKVVKYIGDEVMGIFDKQTKIDDAISTIQRIKNIESNLTEITGADTRVKIALDFGNVFLIKYEGHDELDPQGTPIDRCARIGKYCEPSTVLSSYEFVSKCPFPKQWFKLGNVEMKGLEALPIYQFGEQTIDIIKYPNFQGKPDNQRQAVESFFDITGTWIGEFTDPLQIKHEITLQLIQTNNSLFAAAFISYIVKQESEKRTIVQEVMNGSINQNNIQLQGINYIYIERGDSPSYVLDNFNLKFYKSTKVLKGENNYIMVNKTTVKANILFKKL